MSNESEAQFSEVPFMGETPVRLPMWGVTCERCGRKSGVWRPDVILDVVAALELLSGQGWQLDGEGFVCPDCKPAAGPQQ